MIIMTTPKLYILHTFTALLTGSYGQMLWGFIDGGRPFDRGVWEPDSVDPWPGSRSEPSKWQEKNGDLWMFGGYGFNVEHHPEYLNDLWRFDVDEKRWYVIKPKSRSWPPHRAGASSCGVPGIMLVLYGGSADEGSFYGDTWVYVIASNSWLCLRTESPPHRNEAATWCTLTHMFVFGGRNNQTILTDFWQFSLKDLKWSKLLSGHNTSVLTQTAQPRGRIGAFTWAFHQQKTNNLYMFGGEVPSTYLSHSIYTSEMWEFSLTDKNWSLLSGGDNPVHSPRSDNYTLIGRKSGVTWSDANNDQLWLYGGEVILSYNHNTAFTGDVWLYNTASSQWTWISGQITSEEQRELGEPMVSGRSYTPGARAGALGWTSNNNFYMFGGRVHNKDQVKYANDMWYLTPQRTLAISPWIPILVIFIGLFLVAVLVAVGLYARRIKNHHERSMSYSLVANSDIFDS